MMMFRSGCRERRRSSRKRERGITRKSAQRRLRFEPLENRHLLATLVLDIQLYRADGETEITPDDDTYQVELGDTFFVSIEAQDQRETPKGIISLPLDLEWVSEGPSQSIQYSGEEPPLFPVAVGDSDIITSSFPDQRFVTSFDGRGGAPANTAQGLRGAALPSSATGMPIGGSGLEQFSLMQFTAIAVGRTEFVRTMPGSMSFADGAILDGVTSNPRFIEVVRDDPDSPSLGSLSGFVYLDQNNDGLREDGTGEPKAEMGIPNVTITLARDGQQIQQVTTGPDGWYHFEDLEPGTYTIVETQPDCFHDGIDTLGVVLPEGQTRGEVSNDQFTVELDDGEHGIEYNFGEIGLRASCVNKRLLITSTPPSREVVCDRVGLTCTTVNGTNEADTIVAMTDGSTILVDVNGTSSEFDTAKVQVVMIDAGEGIDSVTINGSSNPDVCYARPSTASMRPSASIRRDDVDLDLGYGIDATNAEQIFIGPAGGDNVVVLHDSKGDDELSAVGSRIGLRIKPAPDIVLEARGLAASDTVRAISQLGDDDTVDGNSPVFSLDLIGGWTIV